MAKFMIEMPHSREACSDMLMEMANGNPDFLSKTTWGCMAGNHTGWGIVEADNIQQVRDILPDDLRDTASVTEINEYTAEDIREMMNKAA